ncbi:MAG: hypothetical protein ACRC3J_01780 [Culicoidibacterales bacterium]
MSEMRKQMEQLRDEVYANLQEFAKRQQVAQYFTEIYMSDIFAAELESDAQVQQAVQTYVTAIFGEYLVFTPNVAELFEAYAQAGLIMYDEYEGNYIHLPTVKATAMMKKLEQLPQVDEETRAIQAVSAFEKFSQQQVVVDEHDLSDEKQLVHNAYLYLVLVYLHVTTESTLQQMIYLQQYIQRIEVVYLTPKAQMKLLAFLELKGYVTTADDTLELTERAAKLFSELETAIDSEEQISFAQQLERFQQV